MLEQILNLMQIRRAITAGVGGFCLVAVVACGSQGSGGASMSTVTPTTKLPSTSDEAPSLFDFSSIHESPLLGAWQTACINATSYSARNEVRFSNETMRWRGISYTATNCADQDFSFEMHNHYETGLNAGEHYELDYTLDKIFFVFSSADAVRQANDYVYCGLKDWRLNVSREVTGKDCGGTVYKSGDVTYDLVRIDQGRKIYFGSFEEGRDGKSPEGRPIAIDPHQAYLKAFGKN